MIVEPLGDHLLTSFVPDAPSFWTRLGRPASVCTSVRTGGSLDYARNSVAAGGQPDDGAAARATATQRLSVQSPLNRTQPAGKRSNRGSMVLETVACGIQVEGPHRRSGRGCRGSPLLCGGKRGDRVAH